MTSPAAPRGRAAAAAGTRQRGRASLVEEIEERLAARGHRVTEPRRQILRLMERLDRHFELEALLRAAPAASRSTVFRTMRLLQEMGVVCRVRLPDGQAAYRLSIASTHHHVTCVDCGAIQEVTHEQLDHVLDGIARSLGYHLTAHRLDIFGHCDDCPDLGDSDAGSRRTA